jgi:hypothetical protein
VLRIWRTHFSKPVGHVRRRRARRLPAPSHSELNSYGVALLSLPLLLAVIRHFRHRDRDRAGSRIKLEAPCRAMNRLAPLHHRGPSPRAIDAKDTGDPRPHPACACSGRWS